jgi:hypothetical protein
MRTDISPNTASAPIQAARKQAVPHFHCPLPISPFALLAGAGLLIAAALVPELLRAQTPATQTTSPSSTPLARPVHRHKRPSMAHPLAVPDPVVPATVTPPAPPPPNWPVLDKPAEASVVWDSHGLTIDAANSSLEQILKDFSADTGAKIEGFSSDQRVFGAYGPGPARDILSQVLQGSGYNVLMIGDRGQGAPRQILLSVRQAIASQPAPRNSASASEEDDVEEPQQPPIPEPVSGHPGFPPGGPPRSPQQIMQEMQQRQQQLQQQQGPGQPPNYQPGVPNQPIYQPNSPNQPN